jgi:hypothetical protein
MSAPTIDTTELLSSPSTWLSVLAAAAAKGDDVQVLQAQARLREMDWLVLTPPDLTKLREAEMLAESQEPAISPGDDAGETTETTTNHPSENGRHDA